MLDQDEPVGFLKIAKCWWTLEVTVMVGGFAAWAV
jgi:hypothetical protein